MEKINVPPQKQIRLPFHVSHLPRKGPATAATCALCRSKPSQYYCPRCNIPYCSLACYQSPSHAQCSEPFYKREIEGEIGRNDRGRTGEEKGKMFELLKRFEEGVGKEDLLELEGGELPEEREGDEEEGQDDGLDELQKALEGIDIDSLSSDALLALLPPSLKTEFLASMSSPDTSPLVQQLLASQDIMDGADEPWWLPSQDATGEPSGASKRRDAPIAMSSPPELAVQREVALRLVYNLLAISIAYVQTTLAFLSSPLTPTSSASAAVKLDAKSSLDHLLSLLPFIVDPKSTLLLPMASEAIVFVSSRSPEQPLPSRSLLRPLLLPSFDLDAPHPLVLALSDVTNLLSSPPSPGAKVSSQSKRIAKKLEYLAACVKALERDVWVRLEEEVGRILDEEKKEDGEEEDDLPGGVQRSEGQELAKSGILEIEDN